MPIWAVGIPGFLDNIGAFVGSWFSGKIVMAVRSKLITEYKGEISS